MSRFDGFTSTAALCVMPIDSKVFKYSGFGCHSSSTLLILMEFVVETANLVFFYFSGFLTLIISVDRFGDDRGENKVTNSLVEKWKSLESGEFRHNLKRLD